MKSFKPTHFDDTVNYSKEHPLKEFSIFMVKALFMLAAFYLIVGGTLEVLLMRMSVEREVKLWNTFSMEGRFKSKTGASEEENDPRQAYLQELFDKIPESQKLPGYNYKIFLMRSDDPNAFALPGGSIAVTTGLLEFLETENAVTFILGHELGHIKNRDHLRGMGFNFASIIVSVLLAGQDQGVTSVLGGIQHLGFLGISRNHETQADEVGLQVVKSVYGHVGGSTEFFEKILEKQGRIEKFVPSIISTHPGGEERIRKLQKRIQRDKSLNEETVPIRKFDIPDNKEDGAAD